MVPVRVEYVERRPVPVAGRGKAGAASSEVGIGHEKAQRTQKALVNLVLFCGYLLSPSAGEPCRLFGGPPILRGPLRLPLKETCARSSPLPPRFQPIGINR